jgi:tagaturonate reductase
MKLSRFSLKNIQHSSLELPEDALFELPEKVLQFGTGVLLRGLPDYFIDKANRMGMFNGRVVIVKSTSHGDTSAFENQDGLFTHCIRGLENGNKVEENIINASVSRVLNATTEWEKILNCAHNEEMKVIISNTTEVGIQLVNDDIRKHPPVSFPGKLLAFLYERFQAFAGAENSGMVIIPTELIPDNGKKLESIVLELAHLNGLDEAFIEWLEKSNHFCSSLVDRIVPGQPDPALKSSIESGFGYTDDLMIMSEVYRLWAIEGNDKVKSLLTFQAADSGVVIAEDINLFRELKLRLLNGTHTLSCGLAFLSGIETVKQAMDDELVSAYIAELMMQEIAPAIPFPVEASVAQDFGMKVLDRFRNPHIKHNWISITVQYSSKMKMRNLPVLLKHYENHSTAPQLISLGFAAFISFMKPVTKEGTQYFGVLDNKRYPIQDDMADLFYKKWQSPEADKIVEAVLKDTALWGEDLMQLPGFYESTQKHFNFIQSKGMKAALAALSSTKVLM